MKELPKWREDEGKDWDDKDGSEEDKGGGTVVVHTESKGSEDVEAFWKEMEASESNTNSPST